LLAGRCSQACTDFAIHLRRAARYLVWPNSRAEAITMRVLRKHAGFVKEERNVIEPQSLLQKPVVGFFSAAS